MDHTSGVPPALVPCATVELWFRRDTSGNLRIMERSNFEILNTGVTLRDFDAPFPIKLAQLTTCLQAPGFECPRTGRLACPGDLIIVGRTNDRPAGGLLWRFAHGLLPEWVWRHTPVLVRDGLCVLDLGIMREQDFLR